MRDSGNVVSASPGSRRSGDRWRAFEGLPASVRHALNEGVTQWCALWVLSHYRACLRQGISARMAARVTVRMLAESDEADVRAFAVRHLKAHGHVLPHVAAQASIQRYGSRP